MNGVFEAAALGDLNDPIEVRIKNVTLCHI